MVKMENCVTMVAVLCHNNTPEIISTKIVLTAQVLVSA